MLPDQTGPHPALIAILRGVTPEAALDVAAVLYEAGFRIIEVPLNSPRPFQSIERIARAYGDRVMVGAGTVVAPEDVRPVAERGGRLILAPNFDPSVVAATKVEGLLSVPGVATPTEAFSALAAGADILKLFPAEVITPAAVKALRAVLPPGTAMAPVGGITPDSMGPYVAAGASLFGIGSALYAPGCDLEDLARKAAAFIDHASALTLPEPAM
ncbi:2-dehydro-3-deoxy-6-phosphogalactonate aldolase [Inquilinus sp. CAU 1745]|uniref:2-dehydro-3-deoxy-6-phosphogalactonate aldolase n=1 Tax=Inquilinus sp. CAU 1745 TaxID=3140369 RepID=UPI00325AD338